MSRKRIVQLWLVLVLLVASFATTASASAHGWSSCPSTYYVQPGDWLAKIARNCGISLSSLMAANPWVGYYIYPGQMLVIPGGYTSPTYYSCGASWDSYGNSYYVVCRGDTLGGIALYYGVSVYQLQWRNNIYNSNRIYAGQIIYPY